MYKLASLTAILILALLLPFFGCSTGSNAIKNPDSYIVATNVEPASLDPAYVYDIASAAQIQNIYETLLKFDKSSTEKFIPGLATEWNVSADGKTYRFLIRGGVTFHNGNPLTPEDVEYSFERGMVQDYSLGPQWLIFEPLFGLGVYTSRSENGLIPLQDIKSKVEVDGNWVQFNLAAPYAPFLQILASSWGSIVDMDWCIAQGDWNGTQESYGALNNPGPNGTPLNSIANGTGPYRLEYWQPGAEISLVRNDEYWGTPAVLKRAVTKFVDEWSVRNLELRNGDIDTAVIPGQAINEVRQWDGVSVYEALPTLMNQAFFFQFIINENSTMIGSGKLDGSGIPLDFFSDVNVRKGFAYAFDWDAYVKDGLSGYGAQIASPMVQGIPYYDPGWPEYTYDPAKAEEYLRVAWGGKLWDTGFELTLVYTSGEITGKVACEILQTNLFNINPKFKINLQIMSWPSMLNEIISGKLPLYLNGWTADYPDPHNFVFPFMHSKGTFAQWQGYANLDADNLIEKAIAAGDPANRQALYNQIAQLYYDDVPSIMVAQLYSVFIFRDWVKGFVYNPIRPVQEMYSYYLNKG